MSKRIALGLAALGLAGVTAGIALAADDPAPAADAPMPAAGFEDEDEMIVNDYPAPGFEDQDEMIVNGYPAPGFEDQDEAIVVDGAGMLVPGYEGDVADMIVE